MACFSQVMSATFNAQIAEAVAILKAIQFSRDSGLFPCVLVSEAQVVVNWIVKGGHQDAECGMVLANIDTLRLEVGGLDVAFTPRKANQVAHILAK
ncbi:hypothetical protein LWI29_010661 [Acer saccharum]|uniref:RNase H type-1 domain-containing protein n=1 Tax=Acer saccharum TaxID=4024 RepID=A0AA39SVQ9_ACESA|nr:hypothetical protein LWI29_010661 [Acer saccharum]